MLNIHHRIKKCVYAIAKAATGTRSGSHARIKLRELGSRVKKHGLSTKQDEPESASPSGGWGYGGSGVEGAGKLGREDCRDGGGGRQAEGTVACWEHHGKAALQALVHLTRHFWASCLFMFKGAAVLAGFSLSDCCRFKL